MSKQITDLVKAYEKHNQHNESVQRALEHQLMNKSAFIERLLENSLVTGNGKAEHKADSSLIDISKLSPATQSYIKTQIEKADKPNGVAKI
jgi:hypothetical protein